MANKPNIYITFRDAERLEKLLDAMPERAFPGKAELEQELVRANLVKSEEIPDNVVTMNSTVTFRVSATGDTFTMTLVYPKDLDETGGTISIFAPVGSALLGLSQGDTIEWPKPGGGVLKVEIMDVIYQPERAGEYHR